MEIVYNPNIDSDNIADRVTTSDYKEYTQIREAFIAKCNGYPANLLEIMYGDLAKADAAWLCTHATTENIREISRIWGAEESYRKLLIDELTLNTRFYMSSSGWQNCGIALRTLNNMYLRELKIPECVPKWISKLNANEVDLLADEITDM